MPLVVKQQKTKKERAKRAVLLFVSLAVGFLNGFFGGGGGMLAVPALHYIEGLPEKESHATAIGVILPLSAVSGLIYLIKGAFPMTGITVGIGVLAGGILGALLLKKLSNKAVASVFYLIMIGAGIKLLF